MEYIEKLSPEFRAKYEGMAIEFLKSDMEYINVSEDEIKKSVMDVSDKELVGAIYDMYYA